MKKQYIKHICLAILTTIICITFFVLILQDTINPKANIHIEETITEEQSDITPATLPSYSTGLNTPESESSLEEETTTAQPSDVQTNRALKEQIDFEAEHPYFVSVNRAENFVTIYGIDFDGEYTVPYKTFICSTGSDPEYTPLGVFEISQKYRWRLMVDGTYAQYAIRIHGPIMLHSVPYLEASNDTLEYWEYNKLGQPASLGCVRLEAKAIYWIYKNCNKGTMVEIYSEPGETPLIQIPKFEKIEEDSPYANWDPTDPDKNNPWKLISKDEKKKKKKAKARTQEETSVRQPAAGKDITSFHIGDYALWQKNIMQ